MINIAINVNKANILHMIVLWCILLEASNLLSANIITLYYKTELIFHERERDIVYLKINILLRKN